MAEVNIKRVKSSEIEFKDKLVSINRVTKVTKGGRTFSFSAVVVVGNENGVVGYGLGKAKEVAAAIAKGVDFAKTSLTPTLSKTARIAPPAITPVPGAAGFKNTLAPLYFADCS